MDREELMEGVALYALGVLAAPEAAAMARRIERDPEARREYDALRATADAVALTADGPVDSARAARMRERLMARVRADAAHPSGAPAALRTRPPARVAFWALGLATAASLVFGIVTVAQDLSLRADLATAQRRASTLQGELAQAERLGAQDRQTLTDLLSPDAKRYDVAQGTVIVRDKRLYFALSKLPPLPRGRVYQAWTALKGSAAMQPSVTFTPNAQGVAVVALPVDAAKIGTVALSVEPEGGSKAPTTTPAFVRPLS